MKIPRHKNIDLADPEATSKHHWNSLATTLEQMLTPVFKARDKDLEDILYRIGERIGEINHEARDRVAAIEDRLDGIEEQFSSILRYYRGWQPTPEEAAKTVNEPLAVERQHAQKANVTKRFNGEFGNEDKA